MAHKSKTQRAKATAAKANRKEREERELEEAAQRAREQQAFRLRMKARMINDEITESLSY